MAGFALRFAHASNLRMDFPLRGTGPLSDAARRLAEDAPAAAWQRVVEACIDRDVAFLLLTPRTAVGALAPCDCRLLLNGLRQLGEFEIPVYWLLAPGEGLGELLLDGLPNNVTLLTDRQNTATLTREGREVATVGPLPSGDAPCAANRLTAATVSEPLLRVWIPPAGGAFDAIPASGNSEASRRGQTAQAANYVACWGGTAEQTCWMGTELWVDPGSPCGRTADETHSTGISIVEWSDGQITEVLRVPTATVRWYSCRLNLSPDSTRDELIERMQFALLEREAAMGEQLWLIDWQIVGSGPEFEQLQLAATRRELESAVDSVLGNSDRLLRAYRWDLRRGGMDASDAVTQRLLEWLADHAESECGTIAKTIGVEAPTAGMRENAERLLAEWLATPAGLAD